MELKKLNERIKVLEYLKRKKPLEKKDNVDVEKNIIDEKPKKEYLRK